MSYLIYLEFYSLYSGTRLRYLFFFPTFRLKLLENCLTLLTLHYFKENLIIVCASYISGQNSSISKFHKNTIEQDEDII